MPDPYSPRPIDQPTGVPLEPDADLSVLDEAKILAAPDDTADRPAWRAALHRWRAEARERTTYTGVLYDHPDGAWAANAWNIAMVWLWDEAVRDWDNERFDADRLLACYQDFGGLDAVVLWHAYPVIGVDPRNQFDWYDVPGLGRLVEDLQQREVRVFVDYNPWDVGTRRSGQSDAARLAALIDRIGVDGVFLDTLKEGDPEIVTAMASLSPRPVLEGESRVPLIRIADHQASWAQWFADSPTPGVLRARWFERRHMMHHIRRWNRDHAAEIRSAWVNGAGVLIWDVVFGVRVDWSPADRHAVRRMRAAYGTFERFVVDGEWEPLTPLDPAATRAGVAGSCWRLGGCALYTLANPTDIPYAGPLLPDRDGDVHVVLGDGTVPAAGIAGVLLVPPDTEPPSGLAELVEANAADPSPSDHGVPPTPGRVVPPPAYGERPPGALTVAAGEHRLPVTWRQRETGLYEAAAYVDDWKPLPPRLHQPREDVRTVRLGSVAVSTREVTNDEYAAFLRETSYRPAEQHRFLAHWHDGGPAPGTGAEPVRYIDLDDARAYARWRDARLPTEDEWQVAAGMTGFERGEPLVWQWTESEHRDGRTRWAILKGGGWFAAEGSEWYVDGGPRDPTWSVRFLLPQAGMGRSECIGFRWAVDLPTGELQR